VGCSHNFKFSIEMFPVLTMLDTDLLHVKQHLSRVIDADEKRPG
jgi:hypothetical protein